MLFLASLLLVYGVSPLVPAQPSDDRAGGGTADHVHAAAQRMDHGDTILITLEIDPGYHVNANPASEEYLIPTNVVFAGPKPDRVGYPPAIRFKPEFSPKPINVYDGNVVITASFAPGILDRSAPLAIMITAQACTDNICLPPADIPLRLNFLPIR
ncbi:MAG TPA: protein-disulfide reductase DsbD domain-containing protein [Stellaceae bacterium]|nr:protein-disulfide reductase DsbD domain-containing protein [Stellaceae bacterium]